MKTVTLISFAIVVACGCSTVTIYEKAADELVVLKVQRNGGYYGSWHPVGTQHAGELTQADEEKAESALSSCLEQLKAQSNDIVRNKPAPSKVMAAGQLIACMRTKGWLYSVDEIIITS